MGPARHCLPLAWQVAQCIASWDIRGPKPQCTVGTRYPPGKGCLRELGLRHIGIQV